MKKKILYGFLSVFVCMAMLVGVSFFAGDNLFVEKEVEAVALEPTTKELWSSHGTTLNLTSPNADVHIYTAGELATFATYVNNGNAVGGQFYFSHKDVYLEADIDLSSYYWVPIGTYKNPFKGNFYGQGHKITGLFLNGNTRASAGDSEEGRTYSTDYGGYVKDESDARNYASGLFGFAEDARIINFSLLNGHSDLITWGINTSEDKNNYYIGSVLGCGIGETKVSDIVVSHSIFVESQGTDPKDGILWDVIEWNEDECADVYVGGLVGRGNYIYDCLVLEKTATWNNPSGSSVSGAGIRLNFTDVMTHEDNTLGDYHVGGIVGVVGSVDDEGEIYGCYSYQQISTDSKSPAVIGDFYTGGIAGYSHVSIYGCNYHGSMTIWNTLKNTSDWDSSAWYYAGGIVGYIQDGAYVQYSFNYGNITSKTLSCVGGVAGRAQDVWYSGNFGKLDVPGTEGTASKDTIRHCGGIVGLLSSSGWVSSCVNYGDVLGPSSGVLSVLTQHFRGYGGIVGYAKNSSVIMKVINYGDINSHYSYTGGIAGWCDGSDGKEVSFLSCVNIGNVADCKETWGIVDRYIMNSITETSSYVEFENCYYLSGCCSSNDHGTSKTISDLNSYKFYTNDSNWLNDGFVNNWDIANASSVYQIYSSNMSEWLFSNLPTSYLGDKDNSYVGNKVKNLSYCLIPASAIGISSFGFSNGLWDFAKIKLSTVVMNDDWDNVVLKNIDCSTIPYLRGVNYSTYSLLSIDLSDAQEWFNVTNSYVSIFSEVYDYENVFKRTNKLSIGKANSQNPYKVGFKICNDYNPYLHGSGNNFTEYYFMVEATNRERDLTIYYVDASSEPTNAAYSYTRTTSKTYGEVSGIKPIYDIWDEPVTSRTKIKYGDTVQFDQTPKLGYQFLGISGYNSWQSNWGETKNVEAFLEFYKNKDETTGKYILGANTDTEFMTRFEGSSYLINLKAPVIYAFYKMVEYSGEISYLDEGSSYLNTLGQLPTSFEKLTISDLLDFIIEQQNGTGLPTTEYSSTGYFSYGYKFTFSVQVKTTDGETTDKGVVSEIDLDKSYVDGIHSVELQSTDLHDETKCIHKYTKTYDFDDFVEVMNDISLDEFDITVNRTPIEFAMRASKMADRYNNYGTHEKYTDDYAGTVVLKKSETDVGTGSLSSVKITDVGENGAVYLYLDEKPGFALDVQKGVLLGGNNAENGVLLDKDVSGLERAQDQSAVYLECGKNLKLDMKNIIIQSFKNEWLTNTDKTIDIYGFFDLQTYSTSGMVEGLEDSLLADIVQIGGYASFSSSQSTPGVHSERYNLHNLNMSVEGGNGVYYFAPITLEAQDYQDNDDLAGYMFAGYYLKNIDGSEVLLSTEKKYIYYVDPTVDVDGNGEPLDRVSLVAKYVRFSPSGVRPNSSTETYRDAITGVTLERTTYFIESAEELLWVSLQLFSGKDNFDNDIVRLCANIDMSGVNMLPIGTEENPFVGIFDGDGYVIENLKLFNQTADDEFYLYSNMGLFGVVENAIIQDFTLVGGAVYGYDNVGSIVGKATNSTFDNINNFSCLVMGDNVEFYDIYGNKLTSETFITSFNNASHNDSRNTYVEAEFTYEGVFATQNNIAGIAAIAENCSFIKVSNYGDVYYDDDFEYVGGLTVNAQTNSFNLCFNEGFVAVFVDSKEAQSQDAGEGSEQHIAQFANGTPVSISNSYYVYLELEGGSMKEKLYVFNATTDAGTTYTGKVSEMPKGTKLSSSDWIVFYDRYVLKVFYWR